jgi:hypothetical protein
MIPYQREREHMEAEDGDEHDAVMGEVIDAAMAVVEGFYVYRPSYQMGSDIARLRIALQKLQ